MEPVTHFLTGACLSRAGFNRKTAYATLAMTLAAEAPDIDVFWGVRGPVAAFQHHRGITHTLIGAPAMALAVTGIVWLIHIWRNKRETIKANELAPRWLLIWLFALIADLSHLLLDYTNNYGIRPFFPFDPHWYGRSIVFIFDPLIFLALLGSLLMPWIFGLADREMGVRRKSFRGRGWAIAALIFIFLWWSLRNAERSHAIALIRNSDLIAAPIVKIDAEPYPIDPFGWHVVAETADTYQSAHVQTLHDEILSDSSDITYKPPVTPAVAAAKQSQLGRAYLDWSEFPLVTDFGNVPIANAPAPEPGWHTVEFDDMRFSYAALGTAGGPTARNPLGAWVYIGPSHEVEGMFMSGREQK